jgi:hypothetical protein
MQPNWRYIALVAGGLVGISSCTLSFEKVSARGDGGTYNEDASALEPRCGNGIVEGYEQCDQQNLNGQTCESATLGSRPVGTLRCGTTCILDTSDCRSVVTTGGTGGSGGMGGTWHGGAGGLDGGGGEGGIASDAGAVTCGSITCFPRTVVVDVEYVTLPGCCVSDSLCGLELSELDTNYLYSPSCQPLHQPGDLDQACPSLMMQTGIGYWYSLDGCCREDHTCGYHHGELDGADLGCVRASHVEFDAAGVVSCGNSNEVTDASAGDASADAG